MLRTSLLRYSRSWAIEPSEDLILNPGFRKGHCPHTHLPESNCQALLSWAWAHPSSLLSRSASRKGQQHPLSFHHRHSHQGWPTPSCASRFAQLCFHNHLPGSNRDTFSAKLPLLGIFLLMLLWFPSSAQALEVRTIAVCKLREFSNHKLVAQRDTGSFRILFLFITFVQRDKFSLCYTALKSAALKAQLVNRPFLI